MGLFCASIHFQTDDDAAVSQALAGMVDGPRVLEADGGWGAAYAPGLLEPADAEFAHLASSVSKHLGIRAVSFWVYDSDIARYWLHDRGELSDRLDSWPGYFEGAAPQPVGGDPKATLPFCRPGTDEAAISRVLESDSAFADDITSGLAGLIGIATERALTDHRDLVDPVSALGRNREPSEILSKLQSQFAQPAQPDQEIDPAAVPMIEAAVAGEPKTLRRLAQEATEIDKPAPATVPGLEALAGLGMAVPGATPSVLMSPLVAAVANRQTAAAQVLLEAGADPNQPHEIYESPVFAACGSGDPETLRLLLDHGGNPVARDSRGQTPLQALEHGRRSLEALAQTQASLEALGIAVPKELDNLAAGAMPTEGWDACEEILRQRGGEG